MPTVFDFLGLALGLIGLIPLLVVIIRYQLPQYKLNQLDATLVETTALLESAVQDGFVPSADFVTIMQARLSL